MDLLSYEVVWNGGAERIHAAARRAALQALAAEALGDDPPPAEAEDAVDAAGGWLEALARVLRDGYPRVFSVYDVWRELYGDRPIGGRELGYLSRARHILESRGQVTRVGRVPTLSGKGRHTLTFQWVPGVEWRPPSPASRHPEDRTFAYVRKRIPEILFTAHPAPLSHAEILAALKPGAEICDGSLMRTLTKVRIVLERAGTIVRVVKPHRRRTWGENAARAPWRVRVRLSAAAYQAIAEKSA